MLLAYKGARFPTAGHICKIVTETRLAFPLMSCPRNKHAFRRRSVGCFSRRERSAHIWIDTGRASNAEKQPTGRGPEGCDENGPAACVARRLRIALDMRPSRALPPAHFDRNERYAYFGDRTLSVQQISCLRLCRVGLLPSVPPYIDR
jgi:hypothetical protein